MNKNLGESGGSQSEQNLSLDWHELSETPDFYEMHEQHEAQAERGRFARIGRKALKVVRRLMRKELTQANQAEASPNEQDTVAVMEETPVADETSMMRTAQRLNDREYASVGVVDEAELTRVAAEREMAEAGIELDDKARQEVKELLGDKMDVAQFWNLVKRCRQVGIEQGDKSGRNFATEQCNKLVTNEEGIIDASRCSQVHDLMRQWMNNLVFGAERKRNPDLKFYLSTDLQTALSLIRESGQDGVPLGARYSDPHGDSRIDTNAFHVSYDHPQPNGSLSNGYKDERYAASQDITFVFPSDVIDTRALQANGPTPTMVNFNFMRSKECPIAIVISDESKRAAVMEALKDNPDIPDMPILSEEVSHWSESDEPPSTERLKWVQQNLPGNKEFLEQRELREQVFEDVDRRKADVLTEAFAERFGEQQMSHIRELCSTMLKSKEQQGQAEFEKTRDFLSQQICREIGVMLDLDPLPDTTSEFRPDKPYGGYCEMSNDVIMLNWANISLEDEVSMASMVGLIAHELWHDWQGQQLRLPSSSEDPERVRFYQYNQDNYISMESPGRSYRDYQTQLIEYEAYHFGGIIGNKMYTYMQEQQKEEAAASKSRPASRLRNLFRRK